jgi:magnesium chelatase family protein
MDRIDLHLEVPAVRYEDLHSPKPGEASSTIRGRIMEARELQLNRFAGEAIYSNAHMKPGHIKKYCGLDAQGQKLLGEALERLGLSARAYHRILKVARTVADLDGRTAIATPHLLEAIQYRSLDRRL